MTDKQQAQIKLLIGCTFLPASYPKRFVRDMAGRPADYELTVNQAAYLDKLMWQYRRQIGIGKVKALGIGAPPKPPSLDDLRALKEWNEASQD